MTLWGSGLKGSGGGERSWQGETPRSVHTSLKKFGCEERR